MVRCTDFRLSVTSILVLPCGSLFECFPLSVHVPCNVLKISFYLEETLQIISLSFFLVTIYNYITQMTTSCSPIT